MSVKTKRHDDISQQDVLLRQSLEQTRDGLYVSSLQTDRWEYLNQAVETITGFSKEELQTLGIAGARQKIHVKDREHYLASLQALAQRGGSDIVEYRWLRQDGGYRWISDSRTVLLGDDGHPQTLVGILRDITESKEAEQARRERERINAAILETTGALIVALDLQGRVVSFNPASEQTTGYSEEEVKGRPIWEVLIAPDEMAQVRGIFERLRTEHLPSRYENDWVTRNGERRRITWSNTAILDEQGSPRYIVSSGLDITERKAIEEERERLLEQWHELNGTLEQRVAERTTQLREMAAELNRVEEQERRRLAQLLHDHLQQLLAAAKISINIMQARAEDALQAEGLTQVNALLDESIAESRSLTAELSPTVLYEAGLGPALEWLGHQMEAKYGLRVQVDAKDLGNRVDEETSVALFRAARELLFNVVKHARVKQAEVRLRRVPGNLLELEVSDRGAGFDPSRIWQQREGGFGLFSIRERLQLLDGQMEIQSAPDQGTRVILRVPWRFKPSTQASEAAPPEAPVIETAAEERPAPSQPSLAQPSSAQPPPEGAMGEPVRVLVVDDHAIVREGLARLLAAEPGIDLVGLASNGQEAIALADQKRPAVVLMDVSMPDMDGIEATRRITEALPRTKIIGLSMYEGSDMAQQMREAGAVDYMPKAGDPAALVRAVRQWAQHK